MGVTCATKSLSANYFAPVPPSALITNSRDVDKYLNQPDIRELIGTDSAVKNFTGHSVAVNRAFRNALDSEFPTQYYIAALLERGVRVLVYVGSNDWICNWVRRNQW